MPSILHIVPDTVTTPRGYYLGSTKDIHGRTEYFEARALGYTTLVAESRSDDFVLSALKEQDLRRHDAALFELPTYPNSLSFLRKHFPHVKRITRPINADFYHHLHALLTNICLNGMHNPLQTMTALRTAFWRLRLDFTCARRSDYVLSITDWEQAHYWRYIAGAGTARCVPYFTPEAYQHEIPTTHKSLQCVCLLSSGGVNPFLLDAAQNFAKAVAGLSQGAAGWSFIITGSLPTDLLAFPQRIKLTGYLESPNGLLAQSRAVAILSDYGFGFKTKLLDAIYNKCYVLVTEKLCRRLPMEVLPFCIVVDVNSRASFSEALDRCMQPYPEGDPNTALRERAFATLDSILGIGA